MGEKVKTNCFTIVPSKCTGCRTCELACSYAQNNALNPHKSRIKVSTNTESGEININISSSCANCRKLYCQSFCTAGAIEVKCIETESLSV